LPRTIPSNDPAHPSGVTSTINITDTGNIQSLKLTGINIKHNFIGEISAYLTHGAKMVIIGDDPGAVAVTSPQGCKGKNITNLTISDAGTKSIETNCTTSNPAYNPAYVYTPSSPLSLPPPATNTFYGDDISGTWDLRIVDRYDYDTNNGSLDSWCLEYTRPTNSTITLSPAENLLLPMGAATYPTGVTKDITIEASSGDNFEISRVEFVSVSTDAENDFIGSVVKELPLPAAIKADKTVKLGSPYTAVLTLAANDKYRFSALCKPTGNGLRTATFKITTNLPDPYDVLSFPLSCNGTVGVYSASVGAGDVNMGSTGLGSTTYKTFDVSNTGNYALTLNQSLSGTDTVIDLQSPAFPLTLALGETKTIKMKCTPSAAGSVNRTLTLSSSDTPNLSTSLDYNFTCAGNAPVAEFTPSSGTVNVGTVLEGANVTTKVIDVKNNNGFGSSAVLNLSSATITGTHPSAFSVVNLPTNIPGNSPNDPTGITVKCDATGLTGATTTGTNYTATLAFNTNDTAKSTVTFTLSCLVKKPEPIATFTPAPNMLNFNTVGSAGGEVAIGIDNGSSATKDLVVTSAGFTPADTVAFELVDAAGDDLAVGASLTIVASLSKTIKVKCKGNVLPGDYSAILTLTINHPDPAKQTITYPVSCTVANDNHPLYSSSPTHGSTIAVGSAQIGTGTWSSSQAIIQVSEIGNDTLKVNVDSLSSEDFAIDSPTLPFTIANNDPPVDIKVKCKPAVAGSSNTATLKLKASDTTDNPVSNYPTPTYNLSCTGLIPAYSSTPTAPSGTINVGTVAVGSAVTTKLKISNSGNALTNLAVNTPVITGTHLNDFSITAGFTAGLPLSVAQGGGTKSVTINCSPTAVGSRVATLQLTTNDPNKATVTYTLSCTGIQGFGTVYSSDPAVIKDPVTSKWSGVIDFGNVPLHTTAPKTLKISESGDTILNVGKPAIATDFLTGDTTTFAVTNDDATLFTTSGSNPFNPGFFISDGTAAKVINLTCQPTTEGAHTATLQLRTDDNDASKATVTYTLKCNGVKAVYSSSPLPAPASTFTCGSSPLLLGTLLGTNHTETLTVTELGTMDLKLSSPVFGGANPGDFAIVSPTFNSTTPITIADGGATAATTQDIKIKFTPSAAGIRTATLTFATNDSDKSPVTYDFSCPAISPGFSSTPAPSSLSCGGDTPAGFDRVETLSITETLGNVDLVVDSATFSGTNSGEFSILSPALTDFPLTIAKGATTAQEIKVKFKPTATGTRTATLTLATKDTTTLATNGTTTKAVTYNFSRQAP